MREERLWIPDSARGERASLGRDADELVARQHHRLAVEGLRLAQEVDPFGARGDEDVGRRPVLDLPRELARGAEARYDAGALEALGERLHHLGEARRREDTDAGGLLGARGRGRAGKG